MRVYHLEDDRYCSASGLRFLELCPGYIFFDIQL